MYLVTGACIGGVTLCISPLLSLAMDQSRKVLNSPNTVTVSSYHLDEMSPSLLQNLQTSLTRLPPTVSTFIFTSPQCFHNRHQFRNFLFQKRLIRFVVVDEIHLFAQFGNTFRNEFRLLKRSLFDQLLQLEHSVPSLFMTATCSTPMLGDIERLTGHTLDRRHWPSPSMMSHRSVGIDVKYTHQHFRILKTTIERAVLPSQSRPNVNRKVIIYTPARTRAKSISKNLGNYLDTTGNLHDLDIVTLIGTMTKEEKAFYTHLFLSDSDNSDFNPRIMCATSGVGNAGIDSSKIGVVYRFGMPETVSDLFQEKGRAGRYHNALAAENRYILCFAIEDLIYLFRRTMDPDEVVLNDDYRKRQVDELMQVAKVLASDECMCAHVERLIGNPDMAHDVSEACNQCSVCRNDKLFFQINKEGTKTVLLELFVFGNGDMDGKPDLKNRVQAIKAFPNVRQLIVSSSRTRKGIKPVKIKKFIFLLLAHGILSLRFESSSKKVQFRLAKSYHDDSVLALQHDPYWVAMNSLVNLDK